MRDLDNEEIKPSSRYGKLLKRCGFNWNDVSELKAGWSHYLLPDSRHLYVKVAELKSIHINSAIHHLLEANNIIVDNTQQFLEFASINIISEPRMQILIFGIRLLACIK